MAKTAVVFRNVSLLVAIVVVFLAKQHLQQAQWQDNTVKTKAHPTFKLESAPISSGMLNCIETIEGTKMDQGVVNRTILLLHVGKTGGTSLQGSFRAACAWFHSRRQQNACWKRFRSANETTLSKHVQSYWHVGPRGDNMFWAEHATTYLITARDPVHRFVSAYLMAHPQNHNDRPSQKQTTTPPATTPSAIFYSCYPTPKSLANLAGLLQKPASDQKDETASSALTPHRCWQSGVLALQQGIGFEHGRLNYRFYSTKTWMKHPEKELLVVRTERLWHDLVSLESQLQSEGSTGQFATLGSAETHGSHRYKVKNDLDNTTDVFRLCCALYHEVRLYQELILRARNLQSQEKCDSLSALYRRCGVGTGDSRHQLNVVNWTAWQAYTCPGAAQSFPHRTR